MVRLPLRQSAYIGGACDAHFARADEAQAVGRLLSLAIILIKYRNTLWSNPDVK